MLASLTAKLPPERKPVDAPRPTTFLRPPFSCLLSSAGELPRWKSIPTPGWYTVQSPNSVPNFVAVLTVLTRSIIALKSGKTLLPEVLVEELGLLGDQRVPPIVDL